MLSRVADSLYWINRYVERAENISRFLEVSEAMALDCPPGSAEPWVPLVDAGGDNPHLVLMHNIVGDTQAYMNLVNSTLLDRHVFGLLHAAHRGLTPRRPRDPVKAGVKGAGGV